VCSSDLDDRLVPAGDGRAEIVDRCPGRKPLDRLRPRPGRAGDRVGRLMRSDERTGEDGRRPNPFGRELLREPPALLAALRAEDTQLVGLAALGVGVADEEHAHAWRIRGRPI